MIASKPPNLWRSACYRKGQAIVIVVASGGNRWLVGSAMLGRTDQPGAEKLFQWLKHCDGVEQGCCKGSERWYRIMEARSITSIKHLEVSQLFQWIKQDRATLDQSFRVVDVRGSDYIGGHIVHCWNFPYKRLSHDSAYMDELVQKLEEQRRVASCDAVMNVVFHCAQSQQRGPSAAMKFLRWLRDDQLRHYQVWILRGGFNRWQDVYGEDSTVTEAYEPDLWSW